MLMQMKSLADRRRLTGMRNEWHPVASWERGNKQIDIQLVASKSGVLENTLPESPLPAPRKLSEANICAK